MSRVAQPLQSIISTPRNDREEEAVDNTGPRIQPQPTEDLPADPSPDPTRSFPHPTTKPHNQQSTSPSPSSLPSTSYHSSIQAWLDQALPASPTTRDLTATHTSSQSDKQDHCLKRKRGALSDLAGSDHTIPLTKKALKQHLALTMSSDQSTIVDVCTPIQSK